MKLDSKNNSIERSMLKDLYESVDGLFAFTFYSKYKIEPENMFSFISKYLGKGIIFYSDNKVTLTNEGKNIILKQLFTNKLPNGRFSNIPLDFLQEKIKINSPYLPNINRVSAEILNQEGGKETSIKEV